MPRTLDAAELARRDAIETFDAFFIVMGLSFFPVLFAGSGLLALHMGWVNFSGFDPSGANAQTMGQGLKALGKGLHFVVYCGCAGFIPPLLYSVHAMRRNMRLRREDAAAEQ